MLDIEQDLSELKERDLFRSLSQAKGVDFASNDYLGFSKNEEIRGQLFELLKSDIALGSTGSRLISGNSDRIEATERFIANTFGAEAALFFGSGYLANLGVVSALGGEGTEFFSDERNHASLIDGIRLSKSPFQIFRHGDPCHLEYLLGKSNAKRRVIVTESVFSMDGDQAPLKTIEGLAKRFGAYLIVDEAHATGTCGDRGLGLAQSLTWQRLISVHTCGKALGSYGAFVCCSGQLQEYFINHARPFIFSTALPPLMVVQTRLALTELLRTARHFSALSKNIDLSMRLFREHGFSHSGSPIVPFIVGNSALALGLAKQLQESGFFVKAIRYPSVPEASARLRITLKSFHTEAEISRLCELLSILTVAEESHRCISS